MEFINKSLHFIFTWPFSCRSYIGTLHSPNILIKKENLFASVLTCLHLANTNIMLVDVEESNIDYKSTRIKYRIGEEDSNTTFAFITNNDIWCRHRPCDNMEILCSIIYPQALCRYFLFFFFFFFYVTKPFGNSLGEFDQPEDIKQQKTTVSIESLPALAPTSQVSQ